MNHADNLKRAPTRRCSALRGLDRPRVAAGVLKTHGPRARQGAGQPLRPLDRDDAGRSEVRVQANLVELGGLEAIEVDVNQRDAATAVLVDDCE